MVYSGLGLFGKARHIQRSFIVASKGMMDDIGSGKEGDVTQGKVDRAFEIFRNIQRQYPFWPSTFTDCECGRMGARGAGKCALCYRDELAELVGLKLAQQAVNAIGDVSLMWSMIREECRK